MNKLENWKKTQNELIDIAKKIQQHLSISKYLVYDTVETKDNSISIYYKHSDSLINEARDSMKNVLKDTDIKIEITMYDNIYIEILYLEEFEAVSYSEGLTLIPECYRIKNLRLWLDTYLSDSILLDNAKNNNTFED